MKNSLKRIREQQSLGVEFIASMLEIRKIQYMEIEKGERNMSKELIEKITRLFGVTKEDIYPQNNEIDDFSNLGWARSYSNVTKKDKAAISKLISLSKKHNR